MNSLSKLMLAILFADYTLTLIQTLTLIRVIKSTPLFRHRDVAVFGKYLPHVGFVYSIGKPFDYYKNPTYYDSESMVRDAIDKALDHKDIKFKQKLIRSFEKLKIIRGLK